MHVLISIVLVLGFSLVLILGLLSVMQALLERTIRQPPLISDENPNSEQLNQSRTVSHNLNDLTYVALPRALLTSGLSTRWASRH
jgi:hypothetical protein